MTLLADPPIKHTPEVDALIKEARRLRRRRWILGLGIPIVVAFVVGGVVVSRGGTSSLRPTTATTPSKTPSVHSAPFAGHGRLAFVSLTRLWVLDGSNGSLRELPTHSANAPGYSSDGRWLAYLSTSPSDPNAASTGQGQLWIARGDGTDPQKVPGLGQVDALAWSPRQDQLAVVTGAGGIALVNPHKRWRLLGGTTHAVNFVWSPDGKQIAFSGYGKYGALEAVAIVGGSPVVWQEERNPLAYPDSMNPTIPAAWLPHGEGLLYWVDPDGSASIEADGLPLYDVLSPHGPAHLLATTLVSPASIAVAPDGALAIASGGRRDQTLEKSVERCDIGAEVCTKVPTPPGDISFEPTWSARGDRLTYAVGPSESIEFSQARVSAWYSKLALWTVSKTSTKPVRVSGSSGGATSTWSPDGEALLFESNNGLWLATGTTTQPSEVASPLFAGGWPNYYAEVDWSGQYAWTPE